MFHPSSPRIGAALALALCLCAPSAAGAKQSAKHGGRQAAKLRASLTPERLGAATTVSLGIQITAKTRVPSALRSIQLAYPRDLGLATSGLGLASCSPATLEALGAEACPADSRMGSGSAVVEIPVGPDIVKETVSLELFAGPSPDGRLHVLVYVSSVFAVHAEFVFSGVLLAGRLRIAVPLIPALPGAPDVAVTRMQVTLGGPLTYYERVHGRNLAYHPPGVGLPDSCPGGGFAFAATFAFADGSHARARTAVPCPRGG
ncbi:MAG TPA: hypothetical protein VK790_01100 [Solirubrobacteraceae bacterium]|jgi:hypothetical protein|nr:hypothetical protein [Solirubrobacteraceae bacterium]